jgi:hypothetical protein
MRYWNIFLFLGAAILLGTGVSRAKAANLTVEVTGQAAESGLGRETTRLRALEAALIEAAIKGGADINGYIAASNGILVSDRLVLRPPLRILDYTILSEGAVDGFYRLTLRAVVGDPPVPISGQCARRAHLEVVSHPPQLRLDPMVPSWIETLSHDLRESINEAIQKRPNISLIKSNEHVAMLGRSAQVGLEMDYTSLTRGATRRSVTPGWLSYHADITLRMQKRNTLSVVLRSRIVDSVTMAVRAQAQHEKNVRLHLGSPSRILNVLTSRDRQRVVQDLLAGIDAHIGTMIDDYACRPLAGTLELSGDQLTLPFGAKDGLTRNHLAYSEGQDRPYILFEIASLKDHSVVLNPIDRNRTKLSLSGTKVRFMEVSQ